MALGWAERGSSDLFHARMPWSSVLAIPEAPGLCQESRRAKEESERAKALWMRMHLPGLAFLVCSCSAYASRGGWSDGRMGWPAGSLRGQEQIRAWEAGTWHWRVRRLFRAARFPRPVRCRLPVDLGLAGKTEASRSSSGTPGTGRRRRSGVQIQRSGRTSMRPGVDLLL